jgi:hypothetical protein
MTRTGTGRERDHGGLTPSAAGPSGLTRVPGRFPEILLAGSPREVTRITLIQLARVFSREAPRMINTPGEEDAIVPRAGSLISIPARAKSIPREG